MTTSRKIAIHKVFQNRPFAGTVAFTLFLYVLEERFLAPRHILYLFMLRSENITTQIWLQGLAQFILSFFVIAIFLWFSFNSQTKYRLIYFILFASVTLIQYNYWNVLHRFLTTIDLNTARNSPPDLWLDAAAIFFDPFAFIPIAIYLLCLWWTRQSQSYTFKGFFLLSLFTISANLAIYSVGQIEAPALSLQDFFQTITKSMLTEAVTYRREEILFQSPSAPQNNVVLIIDESVRGDRLSINGYHRSTTPYLEELAVQGKVYNWGTAVSAGTCSVISNLVLTTGLSVLPDVENRSQQNATIYQYARAMGYQTYYFDAQTKYLWTGLRVDDLQYVDQWINVDVLGNDQGADFRAADQISEIVTQSIGNFIVINKKGVHFHYNDVYPPEQAIWTPIPPRKVYEDPIMVSNTYDNSILYNVDNFFRRLIPDPQILAHTVFLYTSDHGQTLIENDAYWSHCNETKNEALIPLLLIGELDRSVDINYRASHYNIFATLLDLLHVPVEARKYDYPPSLLHVKAADSTDRYYLSGNELLINFDELNSP